MRNISRIDDFCARLAIAWKHVPDQRFGQLMVNIFGDLMATGRDPFFPEEEEMIKFIEDWTEKHSVY